jgi:hypothetical protein
MRHVLRPAQWELRKFTKGYATRWMLLCASEATDAFRQRDMLTPRDANLTDRGIELTIGKARRKVIIRWSWALRIVVKSAQSLRPALPNNVAPLAPPALSPSRFVIRVTSRGFKSVWQRAIREYAKSGYERFGKTTFARRAQVTRGTMRALGSCLFTHRQPRRNGTIGVHRQKQVRCVRYSLLDLGVSPGFSERFSGLLAWANSQNQWKSSRSGT